MKEALRRLPYILVGLGVAGLAISVYLVATHFGKKPIVCGGVGDCNLVNASEYASIGSIPVSVLGVAMYLMLIAAAVSWSLRPTDDRRMVAYWGLALTGAGYAAYLTYVELEILHAICVWCVASASVLTVSLLLSTAALLWLPTDDNPGSPVKARSKAQSPPDPSQSSYNRRRVNP